MEYVKNETARAFKLRWFTENCTEILLPSGKTILVDPMLVKSAEDANSPMEAHFVSGFGPEDIHAVDYVIITHVHGDHIGSLKEIFEMFHPTILVNGWSAFGLSKFLDIPLGAFVPMTDGNHYDFVDFEIDWIQGRHSPAAGARRPSESMGMGRDPKEAEFGQMGTIYNSNFVIDLKNGFRLGVDGGRYEPELLKLEKYRPQLVFCHSTKFPEQNAKVYAESLMRAGGQYLIAWAAQNQADGNDKTIAMTNEILKEKGYWGKAVNPKPGQWLSFDLGLTAE